MWVLKIIGRRANLLLLAHERSKGLLLYKDFSERATVIKAKAIKAKARVNDES